MRGTFLPMARLPLLGTVINTATVLVGSGLGLLVGAWVPEEAKPLTLSAIGIVTLVMGFKMAGRTKQILLAIACLVIGGLAGILLQIPQGVTALAETAKNLTGGGGRFNEGLITASVLFCIGPMTLLGCLEDGLEGKIEILGLKSSLDLVASFFLAVTLGPGVLASALVVLIFQGALTLGARLLKPMAANQSMMDETTGVGGLILVAIGLNLLDLKKIPTEAFLPALVLAPLGAGLIARFAKPTQDPEAA